MAPRPPTAASGLCGLIDAKHDAGERLAQRGRAQRFDVFLVAVPGECHQQIYHRMGLGKTARWVIIGSSCTQVATWVEKPQIAVAEACAKNAELWRLRASAMHCRAGHQT